MSPSALVSVFILTASLALAQEIIEVDSKYRCEQVIENLRTYQGRGDDCCGEEPVSKRFLRSIIDENCVKSPAKCECTIDGKCYSEGDIAEDLNGNPDCSRICDSEASTASWSTVSDKSSSLKKLLQNAANNGLLNFNSETGPVYISKAQYALCAPDMSIQACHQLGFESMTHENCALDCVEALISKYGRPGFACDRSCKQQLPVLKLVASLFSDVNPKSADFSTTATKVLADCRGSGQVENWNLYGQEQGSNYQGENSAFETNQGGNFGGNQGGFGGFGGVPGFSGF